MWTKRFVALPVMLYDKHLKEMAGVKDEKAAFWNVNPYEIAAYRPTYPEGEPDRECTYVELRGGDATMVWLTVKEFEETMNLFTQNP